MRYDLANPMQSEQARSRLALLTKRGAVVEITEKKQRSLSQNAYLHVCLGYFGLQVGEQLEIVKRQYYKIHCNPDLFIREKTDAVLHQRVRYLRTSSDLTREEMTLSIERFRNFASGEAGVYIPTADEHAFIRQMEEEVERARAFL